MKKFAKQQPKHGDRVVTCGHLDSPPFHFFQIQGGLIKFIRPDKTIEETEWVVICNGCLLLSVKEKKTPEQYIRHDDIWQGNAPIVEEDERN